MYLYQSFGNLMEAWVNEESVSPQQRLLQTVDVLAPTADVGLSPRSESVDSGVESTSCGTPSPVTLSSDLTDNTEMDSLLLQSEGLALASTPQSPELSSPLLSSSSSSSPQLCPSRAEKGPSALNLKVEEALRRTASNSRRRVDEVFIRLPGSSLLPKRHASELARCPRSQSFDMRRRFNPSIPLRQMTEMQKSEGFRVKEGKELSPGLFYLEQVCQMLEEAAKQQMSKNVLQKDTEALWEHVEPQETCQTDLSAINEDQFPTHTLENAENVELNSSKPQPPKSRHFRQRSASDTTFALLHSKKLNANPRVQLMSTSNLLETVEEDHVKQEITKEGSSRSFKSWRSKLANLRRSESDASEIKGQNMQSPEKNATRRRLSQLFRRKKT
ncbi:uncharacterized protein si:dkey-106l3.7 [Nothobranchius furzeri]|uniref:LOC107372739-like protein n=1 Tax=Nothobranchius furzeri TaxID=105023 RepID=A0A9D2YB95_NOTFU|nr:putative LOC107372739-like protein [Nothobranchius furzeri]